MYTCRPFEAFIATDFLSKELFGGVNSLRMSMEKIILFAADQWVLVSALAAAVWGLVFLENRQAGPSLTPQLLTQLINDEEKDVVIVDLRDKKEYSQGHIVNAINLPFSQWQKQHADTGKTELDQYHDSTVILVCKMGQQSSHVAKKIVEQPFKATYRLKGGILEWQASNLPLVKS